MQPLSHAERAVNVSRGGEGAPLLAAGAGVRVRGCGEPESATPRQSQTPAPCHPAKHAHTTPHPRAPIHTTPHQSAPVRTNATGRSCGGTPIARRTWSARWSGVRRHVWGLVRGERGYGNGVEALDDLLESERLPGF